ncbi:MAG TPA: TOBE domain-containing protein, partial [Desulfurococcales archaeon]|nr:TOBE domain-containing protein [Desulfurococcales archaeon]
VTIPPDRILLYRIEPRVKINTFKGTIKRIENGVVSEVTVATGGIELVVQMSQSTLSHLNLKVGDEVYIKIPIRHLRVYTLPV